ncbi:hypothetical protein M569_07783 [Genlisea aurea]|uniref:Uncharacterized protein n=1 Tax=Genlisea aurea TaxID=192259 RepID=S8E3Y8_9LAMI|nr:hypothetical protein M569_07783 [Genlisea aurea]
MTGFSAKQVAGGGNTRRNAAAVHWWAAGFKILMVGGVSLGLLALWAVKLRDISADDFDFVVMNVNVSVVVPRRNRDFRNSFTREQQAAEMAGSERLPWISADLEANYSSRLLNSWLAPKDAPCKISRTVDIRVPIVDGIELSTSEIHDFVIQAVDDSGEPRCSGGDYFEIDLSGESWKSRPPVKDLGNGNYTVSLSVHPDFSGDYNLTIILLYRDFEGLKFSPSRFVFDRTLRVIPIKFAPLDPSPQLPELKRCREADFARDAWSGRWTRHARNDSCPISGDGRFRCQEPSFPCSVPWCHGALGSLESNGWVYSAHCSFKLFTSEEAWNCLTDRWIFWWGDSNHCDTIRNVLHFILDVNHHIQKVPRIFDSNVTNPRNPAQVIRITSIFNGHHNATGNYEGLHSLSDAGYREFLRGYFSGDVVPDAVIMNSGLHDGVHWSTVRKFIAKGADYAAGFWNEVVSGIRERGAAKRPPEIIYRTTVAGGGYARSLAFNPQKMEAFNGVVLDKLRRKGILDKVIDGFDMTFPWHYDNRCNDGVHYGRPPSKTRWRDGGIGHQYFVDLMLGHAIINALCAAP